MGYQQKSQIIEIFSMIVLSLKRKNLQDSCYHHSIESENPRGRNRHCSRALCHFTKPTIYL